VCLFVIVVDSSIYIFFYLFNSLPPIATRSTSTVLSLCFYENKKCAVFKNASSFNQVWCSSKWLNSPITPADFYGTNGGKLICCNSGFFYNSKQQVCKICDSGQYNNLTDVTNALPTSCKLCPRNTFGPIKGMPECSSCKSNQYR
jgi:hypothetical protein